MFLRGFLSFSLTAGSGFYKRLEDVELEDILKMLVETVEQFLR